VLAVIVCFTAILGAFSFIGNLRILTALGFAAALFSPLVVRTDYLHFAVLFVFVFTINLVILGFAVVKKWKELPIIGFVATAFLVLAYNVVIRPETWIEPFTYIVLLFIAYAIGVIVLAKREGGPFRAYHITILALSIAWFAVWSVDIFARFHLSLAVPFIIAGFAIIVCAWVINSMFAGSKTAAYTFFVAGVLTVAFAGLFVGDLSRIAGMAHVIRGCVWMAIVFVLFFIGYGMRNRDLIRIGMVFWLIVFIYWLFNAWGIGDVEWFGVAYVPFVNPPGLLWLFISITGFIIAVLGKKSSEKQGADEEKKSKIIYSFSVVMAIIIAILSHIAIGGLLTLEISYLWKFYTIGFSAMFVYSLVWGVYALILFLWGYTNNERLFIYFADIVLVIVLVKILFFDLAGETSIVKAISILLTGIVIVIIGFLNYRREAAISFAKKRRDGEKSSSDS
jgi:hypothetical protein